MMRPIAIVARNTKELEEQARMVQENAYRDGIDTAIDFVKIARNIEQIKDSPLVVQALDDLIKHLPSLYVGIGIPKEQDSVYDRYKLHTIKPLEPVMSAREALMRECGEQDDEE